MSKARRREMPAGNKPPPDDGMPPAIPGCRTPGCLSSAPHCTACLLPRARPDRVHQPREGNRNRCNQKIKYHLQPSLCVADSGQKRFFRLIKGQPIRAALRIHIGSIFQQEPIPSPPPAFRTAHDTKRPCREKICGQSRKTMLTVWAVLLRFRPECCRLSARPSGSRG